MHRSLAYVQLRWRWATVTLIVLIAVSGGWAVESSGMTVRALLLVVLLSAIQAVGVFVGVGLWGLLFGPIYFDREGRPKH
jgi:hypothetical protein